MRAIHGLIRAFAMALPLGCAMPALPANPHLLAYERGIEDPDAESKELRLADVALELDVVGALVDVTMTARFANPSDDELEGRFSIELPDGAVITGYALDIEGQLLDGVLVDPLKARRTFERRVREGIDPGLAEVNLANRFTTRVYPIPAQGERTIQLRFAAPIHPARGFVLPLETDEPVGQFRVDVHGTALDRALDIALPSDMILRWHDLALRDRATAALYGQELDGELRIGPVSAPRALASTHPNGEKRIHIVDAVARTPDARHTGGRLRVYWDRSLSRRDQDLESERRLLAAHVQSMVPVSIDLVVFNSTAATLQRVSAAELDDALDELTYRGGTSFAVLSSLAPPPADRCLVFSDGVATIDPRDPTITDCEVHALTSAPGADRGFLARLAGGDASRVLRVGVQDEEEILARLGGSAPRVVRARTVTGRDLAFATLDGGERGWSVITESPAAGPVILDIAGLERGRVVRRRYAPALARRSSFAAAGALWAFDRVARLAAQDGAHEELVATSRRFSVANPRLSFLVLEDVEDYVEARVEPPANLPAAMRADYDEALASHEADARALREERLEEVVSRWREVVDWWETRFDPEARKPAPARPEPAPAPRAVPRSPEARGGAVSAQDFGGSYGGESIDEIAVTGARVPDPGVVIHIKAAEWNVKRPYLAALDAAAPGDVDFVLESQVDEFGALPVFFFDVAEWFHRHGRPADAEEMLLSALELPLANEETELMVAERLQRHGAQDRAIWLLERAAEATDYLPQPRRSLALALAKRALRPGAPHSLARVDLERALTLLTEVIMTPWEEGFDGIEVIALLEANALLPKAQALHARDVPLDGRLRKRLDVDLRVVVEWNTLATDVDLWVDEPNGERAVYSNPRTAIGGDLSNDMTEGLGPEQYLLRRAAKGEYAISVDVYAEDAINPNGSSVVTARLFRNFGRPEQHEETLEIVLEPDDQGEKLIGTFRVE